MKLLFIHAHYDDYEFTTAGTFEMWKRHARPGESLECKIVVCTDGAAGHHARSRHQTRELRLQEQLESARLGGYQFELLRLPDGTVPREGCQRVTPDFLAALWKVIRDFEPDYLFAPPIPADPLVGVHVDHLAVAQAIRDVAYMINVPHAYTPEYPPEDPVAKPCKVPVIVAVYDGYLFGGNNHDLAVDVEPAFDLITRLTWCHQCQIREWLPWVGRHQMEVPDTLDAWQATLRARFQRKNRELEIQSTRATEVFTITAWGEVPTLAQIQKDFPPLLAEGTHLDRLAARLARWRGEFQA